ncbi:hypothetical protein CHS0354_018519 [Potamilus streckersoni]|uniref:Uncharacterized protein n=1 Tax=Potamilus streckersoni TaxID=2493646 RepID=A0AAE0TBW0_9BIVA|nr:hypothetical protein CHS0354_018519 [Potamilus streckersoni]
MTMLGAVTAAAFGPAVRSFISNTGASEDAGTNLLLVKTDWLLAVSATLFCWRRPKAYLKLKAICCSLPSTAEKSQPYLNALHFFFGLGALVSPALIGIGLDYYGSAVLPYGLIALVFVPLLIAVLSIRRFPDGAPPKEESAVPVKKVKPVAFAGIGLYMMALCPLNSRF